LTEAPINPRKNRDQAAQIFFETFNVPAMFISIQAVLALYASGRTTGIVLDVGDGVSHTVPVYEGFAVQNAIQRSNIAGRDVTDNLRLLMRKEGNDFNTSAEFEIVKLIKEKVCYLSSNPSKDLKDVKYDIFTLPDGNNIKVGSERFMAPEILFNPDLIGLETLGVHQLVLNSIQKCDLDLRKELFANIVLSGGSTLTNGFGDRLLQEIKGGAFKDVKIKIFAPKDRKYSTWVGGSILASLSNLN
jgi:centractin